ncbi:hypothetical protein BGZ63DRAFT_351192, partial [Mariannaea sp. PMI_226]
GRLTEPRNYAPRTAGLPVAHQPPPKFGIPMNRVPSGDNKSNLAQDPFVSSQPSQAVVPYRPSAGSFASTSNAALVPAAPQLTPAPARSTKLIEMTNPSTGLPSVEMALDPSYFPFVDGPRQVVPTNYGVVKLKNIPFATKRSEIIAFLGRTSRILNDSEEPVHIIMDRATSKTMDAYVEFQNLKDAIKAAEKHHTSVANGRICRLGDRPVEVELSSQGSLMKDLFPLAKGVMWDGPQPTFMPTKPREPWENFKGFISCEEMTMLVKHVEVPHRSPFSKECPQRPYESLISTLRKFPWHMTHHITILQRHAVYKATRELIVLLDKAIQKHDDILNLSPQLYKRLVTAALQCKGFTVMQKDDLAFISNTPQDVACRDFGQPLFADNWLHQYALAPKPGIPMDVVEWYICIIREQTHRDLFARPLTDRLFIKEKAKCTNPHWGYFWAEVAYAQGPMFDDTTLAQCAQLEISAIERILTRALGPQIIN